MIDIERPNCIGCHHIHPDNGNCTAVGGFCTAIPAAHCPLIPELRAENEKLRAELEQVKGERDEAVEYLRGQCRYCKRNLVCISRKGPHSNCWEWRGPQEE